MKRRWIALLLSIIAIAAIFIGLRELARSRTYQLFGRLIPRVETAERVIALSFDDGPNSQYASEILEVLAAPKVHATFFVTGAELAAAPDIGRQLVEAGHELGNHTYSHDRMILKSSDFYRKEIEDTDRLIRATGQTSEILFRPPFCYKLAGLPWYLSKTGRTSITWDIEPDSYPKGGSDATGHIGARC
jgi:peptidoglycan/xylan/chitin deacetylase (PgdA/CDA1 family)